MEESGGKFEVGGIEPRAPIDPNDREWGGGLGDNPPETGLRVRRDRR